MAFGGRGMSPGIAAELSGLLGQQTPGGSAPGMDMKGLGQQAESLWKFLDELAENDSEGYNTFLQKQATAAGMPMPGSGGTGNGAAGAAVAQQTVASVKGPVLVLAAAMSGRDGASGRAETAVVHMWAAGPGGSVDPPPSYRASASASPPSLLGFRLPVIRHTPTDVDWSQQQQAQVMHTICDSARASGILLPGCIDPPASQPTAIHTSTSASVSGSGRLAQQQTQQRQQQTQHYHVYVNATTLKEASDGCPVQLLPFVVEAVCQAIESTGSGLKISRSDRVLQVLASAASPQRQQQLREAQQLTAAHAAASGTSAEHLSDGLLSKLMSLGGGGTPATAGRHPAAALPAPAGLSGPQSGKAGGAGASGQKPAAATPRGPLIEELPDTQAPVVLAAQLPQVTQLSDIHADAVTAQDWKRK
ncbi:MAG: hypothetical protein WDW38_004203 [Sanguina aurantia]